MAATVIINEYNGAGETKTANISNTNHGSVDSPNLVPTDNPIVPGENSLEKYQTIEVTAMGGSSKIDNLKVWRTTALAGAAVHLTNARETTYGGAEAYDTPTESLSTKATELMPETEPAGANLGIAGSLAGELTAVGESDRFVHQIQVDGADTEGTTTTMHYQYDETA